MFQQQDLNLTQIIELEKILKQARKNRDEHWNENAAVSKLLNLNLDDFDDVFKGAGRSEVGYAVYKLQKDCKIVDPDLGLTHCEALNLEQTSQFWNVLMMHKILSQSQEDPEKNIGIRNKRAGMLLNF